MTRKEDNAQEETGGEASGAEAEAAKVEGANLQTEGGGGVGPKAKPAGAPASFATVIGQMKAKAPKAKPAASQARLKAAAMKSMSGQRMKAPNMGLVKSAMPKAKAQRTAAEIAAMHAYRAAGGGQKRRAPGPSFPVKRRKGGHKKPPKSTTTTRSLPYKSSTSGPYR